jgi:hypothetical protein
VQCSPAGHQPALLATPFDVTVLDALSAGLGEAGGD